MRTSPWAHPMGCARRERSTLLRAGPRCPALPLLSARCKSWLWRDAASLGATRSEQVVATSVYLAGDGGEADVGASALQSVKGVRVPAQIRFAMVSRSGPGSSFQKSGSQVRQSPLVPWITASASSRGLCELLNQRLASARRGVGPERDVRGLELAPRRAAFARQLRHQRASAARDPAHQDDQRRAELHRPRPSRGDLIHRQPGCWSRTAGRQREGTNGYPRGMNRHEGLLRR